MVPDLRGAAVFLDFDGTITTYDTGLHLLERLAPDEWREIEDRYLRGEIGSRECMTLQWQLLPRDRDLIESVAREVPLDPGFPALLTRLQSLGTKVTVVSDGYGFRAAEVAIEHGLSILTNTIDWNGFTVGFPNSDTACPCSVCGCCKQAPIRAARQRGAMTVVIGDGASDSKAAEIADIVFAKDRLADWCSEAGIHHHRFIDFVDLVTTLTCP